MKIDRNDILQVMDQADAVYLATVNGSAPRIRAMVNHRRKDIYPGPSEFARAAGFTVYFLTSAASGKVRELRANPVASAYFALPRESKGVMLVGNTEEDMKSTGSALGRGLAHLLAWRAVRPDCAVVRLTPKEATGWWGSEPFYLDLRGL
jgi:hypothetical protein